MVELLMLLVVNTHATCLRALESLASLIPRPPGDSSVNVIWLTKLMTNIISLDN